MRTFSHLFHRQDWKIIVSFLIWRIGLFITAFLSIYWISEFGNRFPYWNTLLEPSGLPAWIWGFANFDGVHYLRLVLYGYEASEFTQAFFPLYPLLIKLLTDGNNYVIGALTFSNLLFLGGLLLLYRLFRIDVDEKTAFRSVVLLISFPTAFYFGSVYSESLFFILVLASLLALRQKQYLLAGFFAALSSSTRVLGLLLIPVMVWEIYQDMNNKQLLVKSEQFIKSVASALLVPLGTLVYMWYLKVGFHNPLYFLTSQPAFGAERSSMPVVLLPQVIYRYLNMLFSVPVTSWQFF